MNSETQFWEDLKSGRFVSMVKESAKGKALSNSREVYNILKPLFAEEEDVEQAYFIFMNNKNRIIAIEKLFQGSIASSVIYPREVVKKIIRHRANGVVMGHNHPSGDTAPSLEDRVLTMQIAIATASIDVHFHDHIIIGNGFYSMADAGLLRNMKDQFKNFLKGGYHEFKQLS